MYDSTRAHTLPNDGLLIEDGYHFISGSALPASILPTVTEPTIYFRTNGEVWKNNLGGWELDVASGFDENRLLMDNFFDILFDNEGNALICQ